MQEIDERRRNRFSPLKSDSIGWSGYVIGLLTSLLGFGSHGALIGAIGLGLVVVFYLRTPMNDLLALEFSTHDRVNIGLGVVFVILLFLKFKGFAVLCLGAIFFLYGCLSLKRNKIYLGSAWRLEDRTCYARSDHTFRYWLWTSGYLLLGVLCLVSPLLINEWFAYGDNR
jgi:hypothetical protein